jgi:hypothetical protein
MLSIYSDLPLNRKTEKAELNDKMDQKHQFCQIAKCKIVFSGIIYSSATHHTALGKKTLLYYSCQLEIDHVTQQPKETCQRTCRGPTNQKCPRIFAT